MNESNKSFKKFLIIWFGELISAIGSGLTSFGLGIYVYQQTGKASVMTLVTLCAFLPSILLSLVSGIFADRYNRRILMILGNILSITGISYILFCMFGGGASLLQICVGVAITSIFASLLEPAYKATITDLLTEDEYTKASGLVQIAGSAKYLISPLLAGFILEVCNIEILLIIDILTFIITVFVTFFVSRNIISKKHEKTNSFINELKEGWNAVSKKRGIITLIIMTSLLVFFLGFIEVLSIPMILAFSNSSTVGIIETVAASGMLVSSIIMGVFKIKKGYLKLLSVSMFFEGLFIAMFGLHENIILIGLSGFLFFAMMPFANAAIDYLIRTNIDNSVQGRAWSMIGMISQIGMAISYSVSGILADYIFRPLLVEGGALANSIGKIIGVGTGRGIGLLLIISGILLSITSIILYNIKSVRELEKNHIQENL